MGVGASAGGLAAIEAFLSQVPARSGMAFVVIQHLDPTQKDLLAELLQRATPMKVAQVTDRIQVKPDRVYVIPPNKDLVIEHGFLHLVDPIAPRGLRLPIDLFFRSLAAYAGERGIGVVLSGLGSDGTLGLKAIKERSGLGMVQDPVTAQFDGMPRSAINAGLADIIGAPDELPARLTAFLQRPDLATEGDEPSAETLDLLAKVAILLRAHTGHDFSQYKRNTVYRRVERRMAIHQIDRISTYLRFLQEHPEELDRLFKDLLIGVTNFFRDPAAWTELRDNVIPALLAGRPSGSTVRAWVAGSATGEEAYSLAMVFREAIDQLKPPRNLTIQIFATDLDRESIDKARAGVYPPSIAVDVTANRLSRFFHQHDAGFQVAKTIRESVVFATHNIIMDPPFTRLDLICCRNVLIYLMPELQRRLLPLFHYSLSPGGALFLGEAETAAGFPDLFGAWGTKARLYRRLEASRPPDRLDFPSSSRPAAAPTRPMVDPPGGTLVPQAERLLLERYAPAALLVNAAGDILFASARARTWLEPQRGAAVWNIRTLVGRAGEVELATALRRAQRVTGTVSFPGGIPGSRTRPAADLTLQSVREAGPLRGLVAVVLSEAAPRPKSARSGGGPKASATGTAALRKELAQARRDLQILRQEMQSAEEDLNSANEELQSTNEELQSTNEELTTSKEEMQSMNEELQTVNYELQARVDDLSRITNDMKNVLDNTDIAAVFLDAGLRIRLFTAGSNRIFKLIPTDVGRPITDFASRLSYPGLADDIREVLRTLVAHEVAAETSDGRWLLVRIMPYRTLSNLVDGVALTFTDITASKTLEAGLRATQAGLERHIKEQAVQIDQLNQPDAPGRTG